MGAEKTVWRKALGPPGAAAAKAIAFLLIICLVECASGSCLSYGHSCWGAHGKRSGSVPTTFPKVPDWYLMRLLRRMSADNFEQASQPDTPRELSTLFEDVSDESNIINNAINADMAPLLAAQMRRRPEAIPMLDDNPIEKTKFMQLMRGAPEVEK